MNRSARTCFLAMMLGEALVIGFLLLVGRLGYAGSAPYFGGSHGPSVLRGGSAAEQLVLALPFFGVLLIWSGTWAFPKAAWPYGREMRIGLLAGLLPVVPLGWLDPTGFYGWTVRPISLTTPCLFLYFWLAAHPALLGQEARRRGERCLFLAWGAVTFVLVLAWQLRETAPAFVWNAGLVLLAMRLALGPMTTFAWRPTSGANLRDDPPLPRTAKLEGPWARTCGIAMLAAEAWLVVTIALGPWMSHVGAQRSVAQFGGQPIGPNALFDLVQPLRWNPFLLGVLLLWVAVGTFPKEAWRYGKAVRHGLLVVLAVLLVVLCQTLAWPDQEGAVVTGLAGLGTTSWLALALWLAVHPLLLALESKRKGQSLLSVAWAIVAMTTLMVLPLSLFELSPAFTLTLGVAACAMAMQIVLGIATALAWRRSPSLGGAS